MSVHFDYSKLSTKFQFGNNSETNVKTEHIDKDIETSGQDIKINLISAYVTVKPSEDDKIHLSYSNSNDCNFELENSTSQLTLTQNQGAGVFFGFLFFQNAHENEVVLSIPVGHDGTLSIDGASSEISIYDVEISGYFKIHSISGEITIENCKAKTLETSNTSGDIKLKSIEVDSIQANTISGNMDVSEISQSIPVALASTSGEVYAENINASSLKIENISGNIKLKNAAGQKASLSTTSGETELNSADFSEIVFNTVSGDIEGTVSGAADDYTVYTSTVSGNDSLSSHKGRGEKTLDLSSMSGDFEISFEK